MTRLNNGKWWWAYLDDSGVIHVKRYKNDKIIQNTEQLPFCKGIFEPFEASSFYEAKQIIAMFLDLEQQDQKKRFN